MQFCGSSLLRNHYLMLEKGKWEHSISILWFILFVFVPRRLTFQHPNSKKSKDEIFPKLTPIGTNPTESGTGGSGSEEERSGTWDKEKEIQLPCFQHPDSLPPKLVLYCPPYSTSLPWVPLQVVWGKENLIWGISPFSTLSSLTGRDKRHQRSWWRLAEATLFPWKPQQLSKPSAGRRIKPKPGISRLGIV